MKAVLQRVRKASVVVDGQVVGAIGPGLLGLVGVAQGDSESDAAWLADKVASLRIFEDAAGKMNLSLLDTHKALLAISQFTLLADTKKGRRPSFIKACEPVEARRLYEVFCDESTRVGLTVARGVFGADMKVHLVNDGPVTLILDSRDD